MDIDDEDGVVFLPVIFGQLHGDPRDQVINLPVHLLAVVLHGLLVPFLDFVEDVLHFPRPPHLAGGQHHHALVQEHPVYPTGGSSPVRVLAETGPS